MAVAFRRKMSSLSSRPALFTALLAAFNVASAQYEWDDEPACDNPRVSIVNQTDIDFYKTCPVIDSSFFFIDHEFKGPFELPGVVSLPSFSSGYYGPKLKGSDWRGDIVSFCAICFFVKLEAVAKDFVVIGSYGVRNITLPALTTAGAMLLDGDFDDCPALGAAFASVTFTATEDDLYQGFTCWTGYEDNSWNSSDPSNNPKPGDSSSTGTGSGSGSGSGSSTSAGYVCATLSSLSLC
ncbi:hypothetical protein KVR01_011685 [Diaporthe batatas]|uniref:uncharacterized protein n=1 Tax=Diaporthe batatas TaxID=748121 RepID=UPI001D0555A2|nr:uncharacterized protein KVR01_011685 [Diaporthe batatas]KAG8158563.1 hypothetical protein KVR01_011685 [Diaporthe batatas]